MKDFIVGQFQGWLKGLLFAGVMMLCCSPIGCVMMRPQDDVTYHLTGKELTDLPAAKEDYQHNTYVKVSGSIRPDTFMANRKGLIDDTLDFKFQLVGQPDALVLHVVDGQLQSQLANAIIRDNRANPVRLSEDEQSKEVAGRAFGETRFDVGGADLAKVLAEEHTFEGRLYRSDASMWGPFSSYFGAEDGRINRYFDDVLKVDLDEEGNQAWLLAVGEAPSAGRFTDSGAFIMMLGMTAGLITLIVLLSKASKENARKG